MFLHNKGLIDDDFNIANVVKNQNGAIIEVLVRRNPERRREFMTHGISLPLDMLFNTH